MPELMHQHRQVEQVLMPERVVREVLQPLVGVAEEVFIPLGQLMVFLFQAVMDFNKAVQELYIQDTRREGLAEEQQLLIRELAIWRLEQEEDIAEEVETLQVPELLITQDKREVLIMEVPAN